MSLWKSLSSWTHFESFGLPMVYFGDPLGRIGNIDTCHARIFVVKVRLKWRMDSNHVGKMASAAP